MVRSLLIACIALLVTGGCRDGRSPVDPLPHDPSPIRVEIGSNDPNTIIAFGDSISDGYYSENGMGYRDDLEAFFATDGRPGIRVLDEAVPGTYSHAGVARIEETLERTRPAVMILLYGTNDERAGVPQELFAEVVATTSENLRFIINAARARSTVVVLSTIPPVCGEHRVGQRANIITMNEKIRAMGAELHAADRGVILADAWGAFLREGAPDGCSLINMDYGNHPNEDGYSVLARTYYDVLRDARW